MTMDLPIRYRQNRSDSAFWRELGFDEEAADTAAYCFPETYYYYYGIGSPHPEEEHRHMEHSCRQYALDSAAHAPLIYRTDAKHPVFWLTQGHDFDEAFKRSLAAIAMLKLQREGNPSPPPSERDNFREVAQALLMQGAVQRHLEGPDSHNDQSYDVPSREPFHPDDYPRFRTGGS